MKSLLNLVTDNGILVRRRLPNAASIAEGNFDKDVLYECRGYPRFC
jgi:hypothetical protein